MSAPPLPPPVFFYFFDHAPLNPPFAAGVPGSNGTAGVSHAFEMQFVWQGQRYDPMGQKLNDSGKAPKPQC